MFKWLRAHMTPSLIVAVAAVVLASAGTGVAQRALIDSRDVRNNSLTGQDIRNRSLTQADFRALVAGPRGPQGPAGLTGPQGPAGVANVTNVDGPAGFQCANGGGGCQVASSTAACPAGMVAVGGGFNADTPDNVVSYAKRGATSYGVVATNFWSSSGSVTAQVICASGPGVNAARARTSSVQRDLDERVERMRDQLNR